MWSERGIRARLRPIPVGLALWIGFGALYAVLAAELGSNGALDHFNILFGIDTPRVVRDMTDPWAKHARSTAHPIFVLLTNPMGCLLASVIGSPLAAAVALNCALAALGPVLAYLLNRQLGRDPIGALLLAFLFGFSTSQVVVGAVPDTTSLATCSLLVTHLLFARSLAARHFGPGPWILAGAFAMGVTVTNLAQPLICRGVALLDQLRSGEFARSLRSMLAAASGAVLCVCVANVVQRLMYPRSAVFFFPSSYAQELSYVSDFSFAHPLTALMLLARQFLIGNVISPIPAMERLPDPRLYGTTFTSPWSFAPVGWAAALLWGAALAGAAIAGLRSRTLDRRLAAAVLCILFNFALHALYGIGAGGGELFLYCPNLTFLVVALGGSWLAAPLRARRAGLVLLVVLAAWNNLAVLGRMVTAYRGP